MKSRKYTENFIRFYIIGVLFIIVGIILINMEYNTLYYSLIAIGILFLILGINETLKSI